VGERGPELFVPDVAGTIMPNRSLTTGGDGEIVVNQYISIHPDVSAVAREEIGRQLPMIGNYAANAVAQKTSRGGSYARVIRGG
jgi:hypothetical protein